MKTIDLLILFPLLIGAYTGYKRGLLLEIVAILAFVIAVVLGFKLLDYGLDFLSPYVGGSNRFLPYFAFASYWTCESGYRTTRMPRSCMAFLLFRLVGPLHLVCVVRVAVHFPLGTVVPFPNYPRVGTRLLPV